MFFNIIIIEQIEEKRNIFRNIFSKISDPLGKKLREKYNPRTKDTLGKTYSIH